VSPALACVPRAAGGAEIGYVGLTKDQGRLTRIVTTSGLLWQNIRNSG